MKTIIKHLILAVFALLISIFSNAQSTAGASAMAAVVTPVSVSGGPVTISKWADDAHAARRQIFFKGGGNRFNSLFVELPATRKIYNAAEFSIEGLPETLITHTLPGSIELENINGREKMVLVPVSERNAVNVIPAGGIQKVQVPAKLIMDTNQPIGKYFSRDFMVTVNFN